MLLHTEMVVARIPPAGTDHRVLLLSRVVVERPSKQQVLKIYRNMEKRTKKGFQSTHTPSAACAEKDSRFFLPSARPPLLLLLLRHSTGRRRRAG